MPRRNTKGTTARTFELEERLYASLVRLAARNGRTIKDELQHAIARHLRQPPVPTEDDEWLEVPPLSEARLE